MKCQQVVLLISLPDSTCVTSLSHQRPLPLINHSLASDKPLWQRIGYVRGHVLVGGEKYRSEYLCCPPEESYKEKVIIVVPRVYSIAQCSYITVKWPQTINIDDPMTHFVCCLHLPTQFIALC